MMIETTNHDWIRILILDVMSNLIDKVENENSKYKIAIFAYKQRLLSLDMKTELVQHVESD